MSRFKDLSSKLDREYQQGRPLNPPQPTSRQSNLLTSETAERLESATTSPEDDLSPDRDSIQRMRWVFDRILEILPAAAKADMRYSVMSTLMRESLKDLARIPDRVMLPMVAEIQQAMDFVANGSMEELRAWLESEEHDDAG